MTAITSRAVLALIFAAGMAGPAMVAAQSAPPAPPAPPANAVRPEFAIPFNAAQDLLKAGRSPEALAKLKDAEALGNLSPYERYLLLRVRGPAEYANGDIASALVDFDAVLASDQLPAPDRLVILRSEAEILYSDKQYARATTAIQRYLDAGGQDAQLRDLQPQAMYMTKDFSNATRLFKAQVDAQVAAGQKPAEKTLRLLASSQSQGGDDAGYVVTLGRLAVFYPKADYWKELIARATRADKFSDRLYVDVYRLKAAALGQVDDSERLSFAALTLRAGFPAEARRVLDDGLARKAFTGADLGEATRLREQAARAAAQDKAQATANEGAARAAKDGNALLNLGLLATVDGDAEHGLPLMEQGLAKGGAKSPDEARLHLGIAQWTAGRLPEALKTFQSVSGDAGVTALARVWALLVQSKLNAAGTPPAAS